MKSFIIKITGEEEKALLTDMISIQDWLDNAIHEKARRVIDHIIKKTTEFQPEKIAKNQKIQIIKDATLETAVERNIRLHKEMLKSTE